ncbi:alcohol dehydrogenase catalytic domain-containing protein [Rathayibacter soli]|uniref:alcohol dehydrogenase catalytic domain-containing protein n=1 Tax=Rathayibacter soli TaxID=3144168 RepID=UPI0027E5B98F|nr:alcohol dehydrogenase catalytic domain-containing protein [Glaciibacter superstes]
MKALVFTEAGVVKLLERQEPVVGADETLVAVRSSAICGSELHGFQSVGFRTPPLIMGHEFAGTTPDGRRVVINPLLSCGHCERCLSGQPELCSARALVGVNRDGGFAERVTVPTSSLRDLPDTVRWSEAALIEPVANAVHAVAHVGADARRVGVIGAGTIGLVCALVARAGGAEVEIADVAEHRRSVAAGLGFGATAELEGRFDGVIDAVGLPLSRQAAVDRCRSGGTAVWIGLAADAVELSGNALVRSEKKIVGSFAYSREEFDHAIELAASLDLSWGTAVPLSSSEDVFYALASGDTSMVKAVIVPDAEVAE